MATNTGVQQKITDIVGMLGFMIALDNKTPVSTTVDELMKLFLSYGEQCKREGFEQGQNSITCVKLVTSTKDLPVMDGALTQKDTSEGEV